MTLRFGFLGACLAALVACGGVPCDTPRCKKDPRPSDQMIQTCNGAHANRCSGTYDDWQRCIRDNTTCDVLQMSDPVSRESAIQMCAPKYETYRACAANL